MAQDREKSVSEKDYGCGFWNTEQTLIRFTGNPQSFKKSCTAENTTSLDKEDSSKWKEASGK